MNHSMIPEHPSSPISKGANLHETLHSHVTNTVNSTSMAHNMLSGKTMSKSCDLFEPQPSEQIDGSDNTSPQDEEDLKSKSRAKEVLDLFLEELPDAGTQLFWQPLAEFNKFSLFPTEIKEMIWRCTMQGDRLIFLAEFMSEGTSKFRPVFPNNPAMHINQESRAITRPHYQMICEAETTRPVFINPERDMLLLQNTSVEFPVPRSTFPMGIFYWDGALKSTEDDLPYGVPSPDSESYPTLQRRPNAFSNLAVVKKGIMIQVIRPMNHRLKSFTVWGVHTKNRGWVLGETNRGSFVLHNLEPLFNFGHGELSHEYNEQTYIKRMARDGTLGIIDTNSMEFLTRENLRKLYNHEKNLFRGYEAPSVGFNLRQDIIYVGHKREHGEEAKEEGEAQVGEEGR